MIGFPGYGLSVEARKRLTMYVFLQRSTEDVELTFRSFPPLCSGVELAAKPQLLLFLDEPTSGDYSSLILW